MNDGIKITANYICKLETELEYRMFAASFKSVQGFCDSITVVYAPNSSEPIPERLGKILETSTCVVAILHHTGPVTSFAEIRNKALDTVPENTFFYWIDADEVGFPEHLKALRARMVRFEKAYPGQLTQVRTRFTHFCISPRWFERMEPRNTIMRKGKDTRWEGSVHERVVGLPEGLTLHTDYTLHHYGYCKAQEDVFKHWQHYAELEGDPNRYINEEVDGKTVPYFREGERPTPNHILEDRKKVLVPYAGEYPDISLLNYLESVCPHV